MSLVEEAGKFINSGHPIPYEHAIALWNEFVLLKKDTLRLTDLLESKQDLSKNISDAIRLVKRNRTT